MSVVGERLFDRTDGKDGSAKNGIIEFSEFCSFTKYVGWKEDDAKKMWDQSDSDSSGTMSKDEWLKFASQDGVVDYVKQIEAVLPPVVAVSEGGDDEKTTAGDRLFAFLDGAGGGEKNGSVQWDEFAKLAQVVKWSYQQASDLWNQSDTDKSGSMNLEEFLAFAARPEVKPTLFNLETSVCGPRDPPKKAAAGSWAARIPKAAGGTDAASRAAARAAYAPKSNDTGLAEAMKNMSVADATPTATELKDISAACDRLWKLDFNRLTPLQDYDIDLQHGKKPYNLGDTASDPLFNFVHEDVFKRPTYKAFYSLLDNYERKTGVAEKETSHERAENHAFIAAINKTPVMQFLHKYLKAKNLVGSRPEEFEKLILDLWFKFYRREANNDSSGFEHVFLGEEKGGKIMGMHNWVNLYKEEKAKALDYKGYIFPRGRGRYAGEPAETEQVITIQFSVDGVMKPVSTSFIGVSPEFEIALYTLCFLCGQEKNIVKLGPYQLQVVCYKMGHGKNVKLGSSFPESL